MSRGGWGPAERSKHEPAGVAAPPRGAGMSRRALPWVALALVLVTALGVGARRPAGPETEAQRVRRLASEVRCPTCRGLSAAESDALAARAIRDDIRDRVRAGQDDGAILQSMVDRHGRDILLRPEGRGVAALVWALPVAATVLAAAGLTVAFRRWRPRPSEPSADDRALVERALAREGTSP